MLSIQNHCMTWVTINLGYPIWLPCNLSLNPYSSWSCYYLRNLLELLATSIVHNSSPLDLVNFGALLSIIQVCSSFNWGGNNYYPYYTYSTLPKKWMFILIFILSIYCMKGVWQNASKDWFMWIWPPWHPFWCLYLYWMLNNPL
jgi:hypothetical protein